MYSRRHHHRVEWTRGAIRFNYISIQEIILSAWVPLVWQRLYRGVPSDHILRCPKVREEEHDLVYSRVFAYWRYQC